jgi:uncharacterized protein YjaG (DUF416 family)
MYKRNLVDLSWNIPLSLEIIILCDNMFANFGMFCLVLVFKDSLLCTFHAGPITHQILKYSWKIMQAFYEVSY